MAEEQHGFIVRDRNGGLVEYYGKSTVSFDATDGGIVTFTKGVAVENVPILLDFSAGDQSVRVDDGYLVKSAVIEKPVDLVAENIRRGKVIANIEGDFIGDTEEITVDGDNDLNFAGGDGDFVVEPSSEEKVISKVTISKPSELIPDNIAKGVIIAGVEGTHSGTQEIVQVEGSYTPTVSGNVTIEHNLGVIPDIIMVRGNVKAVGYFANITGFAEEIAQNGDFQKAQVNYSSGLVYMTGALNIFSDSDSNGLIHSATPKIFKVGGSSVAHEVGKTYSWTVIGGLVHRQGYFFMRLALDGNGNLIVTGGVPAIQQLKIYVDGTLSKTVDYAHADEVTIDISDVAGEFQEYTITVEGVGENLNSQYPYSFYDTVTGYTVSLGGSCGASAYWRLTGDGTLTIYGEGAMDDYAAATDQPWNAYASIISRVVVEYGITRTGMRAFQYTSTKTIELPDSLVEIARNIAYGCTSLTSITIPDSVTSIGTYAFYQCTSLTSITIPYGITTLPYCFVYACSNLTNVTIPNSVTSLDSYAFSNCTSLSSITLPDSLTSIGTYAFRYCAFESLVIPNGVTSINNNAFDSCASLVSIDIPESVTSIGNYAFQNCSKLSAVNLSDNLTSIGTYAFYKCTSLKSITIPAGVTRIENSAIRGCTSLATINILGAITYIGEYALADSIITSFVIPDTVTEIVNGAFYACTKLTSVTIGSGVKSIGATAFTNCSNLTSAYFKVTSGWKRYSSATSTSGTTISSSYLSSTSTAATYLRSTYAGYYWKRT